VHEIDIEAIVQEIACLKRQIPRVTHKGIEWTDREKLLVWHLWQNCHKGNLARLLKRDSSTIRNLYQSMKEGTVCMSDGTSMPEAGMIVGNSLLDKACAPEGQSAS
jgi:hypothetical protein